MRVLLRSVPVDIALAVVLSALSVASLAVQYGGRAGWLSYVLAVLSMAPLAWRQRLPLTSTLVMCAAVIAHLLLGLGDYANSGVGLLIGLFSVFLLRSWRIGLIALAGGVVTAAVVFSVTIGDIGKWPLFGSVVVQFLVACALGVITKRWSRRMERLAEQAARAVSEERMRIAHELHDMVAHHMSVISLQTGVAEYVLDSDPAVAREALATVGSTSREALSEMRRLLAVLRVDQPYGTGSQPGLSELDGLLDRVRTAGLPVELVVTGTRRPLQPGPDLCAYRVAQESLTNVLKHAGPATARLDLDYGEQALTLRVTDNGRGTTPVRRDPGIPSRGIIGMRERAELYGGVLTTGPGTDGGFAVLLRLPYGAAA